MVIEILKKPSESRKKYEIVLLEKSLKSVKFLQDLKLQLNKEVLEQLHYKLKYEYVPRRRVVFNLGEIGKKFYIILKGSVYILLKKAGLEPSLDEMKDSATEIKNESSLGSNQQKQNLLKKIMKTDNGDYNELEELTDEYYINLKFPNFMIIRVMKNGESFGEVALRQNVARYFKESF